MITSEIVVAYTLCKLKAYLLLSSDKKGIPHEYASILEEESKKNREKYLSRIKMKIPEAKSYSPEEMNKGISILLEADLVFGDLEAYADTLTIIEEVPSQRRHNYAPTLVVGTYKINKEQKLQLSFIGHVLSRFQKVKPATGILVGCGDEKHKIRLEPIYKEVGQILSKLKVWISDEEVEYPPVILNNHCSYCPFQNECEAKAKEQDHLSLLRKMSEKEIKTQNKKGIFTVTQFSYTYRARKRSKRKEEKTPKYYHSLKALAIRNNKIYVVKKPGVRQTGTLMFLDVEGIPDQDFYYLIGLLIVEEESTKKFSFWADEENDEENIWQEFLSVIRGYNKLTLFHYGSYETKFIERMGKKYGKDKDAELLRKIRFSMVNSLSLIYANIYFPTYTNSLKDIGAYLEQKWIEEDATGLQSIVWRHGWQKRRTNHLREKLIQYNLEDCTALKKVTETVANIASNNEPNVVSVEDIKVASVYKFGRNKFVLDDLDFVNKCAYFDYQREKIFFRDKKRIHKQKSKGNIRTRKRYHINKKIEITMPKKCYKCGSVKILRHRKCSKIVLDLKFFNFGIKRWIIKYSTSRVMCKNCETTFLPPKYKKIGSYYGYQLRVWIVYQIVVLRQSYPRIQKNLQEIFNLYLETSLFTKTIFSMANRYNGAYIKILKKLINGNLIHADETSVSIRGIIAYVWVFTSLEDVYYIYSSTREGAILDEVLKGFKGVLVSDYYSAYDSVPCLQQKCLIHLIRDMNDDLRANPFDEEYKTIIKDFTQLLKMIITTVDKYGLKKHNLHKHKKDVEKFYKTLFSIEYKSEIATKYQKKFNNYHDKLFTFLDYDGIPWNNNNAEHAVKAFVAHRKMNNGCHTENGIKPYLELLSLYKTCEYKGIDFLQFMLSGETDIDQFCNG